MTTKEEAWSELPGRLWTISAKIEGIGYLLKCHNASGEPAGSDAFYGLGELLRGLAGELNEIRDGIESARQ